MSMTSGGVPSSGFGLAAVAPPPSPPPRVTSTIPPVASPATAATPSTRATLALLPGIRGARPTFRDSPGEGFGSIRLVRCMEEGTGKRVGQVEQSYRDHLAAVKRQIREQTPAESAERLASEPAPAILDVRERDEYEQGYIPGAVHIPRGNLESRIENTVSDRNAPVILYCAAGNRSAFAAKTLHEFGYTDVVSLAGGFSGWKQNGHEWKLPHTLTPQQQERYSRHTLIPEVGEAGQLRLLESKVLLIGAGGLGSPAALYLAAAGVGTIGIIDSDVVDRSNLQRQILHTEDRIGMAKVDSAEIAMSALNPDITIVKYTERLTSENVLDVITGYDVIVDGTDNFPTR